MNNVKRISKKLALGAETLRRLQPDALRGAVGGKPTIIPRTEITCDLLSCIVNSCQICGPV